MYKKTRALWHYFLREAKLELLDATDASESNAPILVALSRWIFSRRDSTPACGVEGSAVAV